MLSLQRMMGFMATPWRGNKRTINCEISFLLLHPQPHHRHKVYLAVDKRTSVSEDSLGKREGTFTILLRPFPAHSLCVFLIRFIVLGNICRQGVVWIRCRQERLYRQEDRADL